jgi:hypothetical protein
MLKNILLISAILASIHAVAQDKKVIIVNGGNFSDPNNVVKVATYNPFFPSQIGYREIDTIKGNSVTGLSIQKEHFLVSTNDKLTLYNAATSTRLSQLRGISGVRGTAWINDTLVCAAFGYGTPAGEGTIRFYSVKPTAILEVRRIGDTTLADYPIATESDVYVGLLGLYTATTASILKIHTGLLTIAPMEINMGSRGVGYQKPILINGKLLSINTGPYGSDTSNLMTVNLNNSNAPSFQHIDRAITKTIGNDESSLIIHSNTGRAGIYKYNFNFPSIGPLIFPIADIAGGAYDAGSNEYYIASANFTGNSKLYQIRANTGSVDSINIGTSPEQIAVWDDRYLSVGEKIATKSFSIYPNPATDYFTLSGIEEPITSVKLVSSIGIINNLPVVNHKVSVQGLSSGMYRVLVAGSTYKSVGLIVK